jgi:Polyketide cyclase / dehydrase and lipid transport
MAGMSNLTFADSVVVARPVRAVYDLVSDITGMGKWSPICRACWWDDGAGPEAGAWFTGRNELDGRTWETRSQVTAAEPGREFTFLVGGALVRWTYRFEAAGPGTVLTEEWEFLPAGIERFHERYGDEAQAQIDQRAAAARHGIPVTLAAIKQAAESG